MVKTVIDLLMVAYNIFSFLQFIILIYYLIKLNYYYYYYYLNNNHLSMDHLNSFLKKFMSAFCYKIFLFLKLF